MNDTLTTERQQDIHVTSEYDKFITLGGNRQLDKGHINKLRAKIENEGNLTSEFPVVVNDKFEIIDGQHRIAALKELYYPVYYVVQKGLNLDTVRQINLGRRNWTWLDYATSYAKEGKKDYQDLIDFNQMSGLGKKPLMQYCGYKGTLQDYQAGDFRIDDKAVTFKLLNGLAGCEEALGYSPRGNFPVALYNIMVNKDYEQSRMLKALRQYSGLLETWHTVKDWQRNIETIYNHGYSEANRVRLF